MSEENFERPNLGAMDPTIVLAALAGETKHVGLVATSSTTYNEPYNIARRFASLDHLSGGRAAWNIVTTFVPDVAANFGDAALPNHDGRYERAKEPSMSSVGCGRAGRRTRWSATKPAARSPSALASMRSIMSARTIRGRRTAHAAALPQGWPVLFQAGSSEPGRELAARFADVVFTAQHDRGRSGFSRRCPPPGRGARPVIPTLSGVPWTAAGAGRHRGPKPAPARTTRRIEWQAELKKARAARRGTGRGPEARRADAGRPDQANKGIPCQGLPQCRQRRLANEENLTVGGELHQTAAVIGRWSARPSRSPSMIEAWHREVLLMAST